VARSVPQAPSWKKDVPRRRAAGPRWGVFVLVGVVLVLAGLGLAYFLGLLRF
jgi:hypothetical protein